MHVWADTSGGGGLPIADIIGGLLDPLPQAVRVIGRMPDEAPLNDLLGGHRVLAENRERDGAVEVLITEAAQVRCGHGAVVTQPRQNLIPRQRGVLRRLPGVAFIRGADCGWDLPPRNNRLDES